MDKTFKCTPLENGFGVEFGDQKFMVSYDETCLPWDEAKKWCEEKGTRLPGIEELMTLHEHRSEINAMLEKAEKETLGGWYWSGREHATNPRSAWYVYLYYGNTDWGNKNLNGSVRAVSAFPSEIE